MTSTESSDLAPKRTGYYPWWLDNLADDATDRNREPRNSASEGA